MKVFKKITAFAVALVLSLSFVSPMAAASIEEDILARLNAGINGMKIPADIMNEIKTSLAESSSSLKPGDLAAVNQAMDLLAARATANNITNFADINITAAQASNMQTQINAIFSTVADGALKDIKLDLTADSNGGVKVVLKDADGGVVAQAAVSEAGKVQTGANTKTGFDYSTSLMASAGLIGLLGVCAVVAKKRNLFA